MTIDSVAMTSVDLPTVTGTYDVTISGLGWTPKAILVIANSSAGTAIEGHKRLSIGASDGTREWCYATGSEDAVLTSDSTRVFRTDRVILTIEQVGFGLAYEHQSSALNGSAGPISNGWRFDALEADRTGRAIIFFFGGSGTPAYAASVIPTTGGLDITAPGFKPTIIFMSTAGVPSGSIGQIHDIISLGVAAINSGGTDYDNFCNMGSSQDGQSVSNSGHQVRNDACVGQIYNDSVSWHAACGSPDSNGFTLTSNATPGDDLVGYLALDTGSLGTYAAIVDSPTSTASDWTVSGPGFQPQIGCVFTNFNDAVNATDVGTDMGCWAFDTSRERWLSGYSIDDQSSMVEKVNYDTSLKKYSSDNVSTLSHDMSSPVFNSNGWTVTAANISSADSTARKWIVWAIEEVSSGINMDLLSLGSRTMQQVDADVNIEMELLSKGSRSILEVSPELNISLDQLLIGSRTFPSFTVSGSITISMDQLQLISRSMLDVGADLSLVLSKLQLTSRTFPALTVGTAISMSLLTTGDRSMLDYTLSGAVNIDMDLLLLTQRTMYSFALPRRDNIFRDQYDPVYFPIFRDPYDIDSEEAEFLL